tara:strand:+ start:8681 stop:9214 length:534 start_codon:yes stop_codon:yes gene_type:complete
MVNKSKNILSSAIFLGTRLEALEMLMKYFHVVKVITTKNSYVRKKYRDSFLVNKKNKSAVFSTIKKSNVKLIFSSGFPFILPKYLLDKKNNKIYLNSHPSYLPKYKGRKCISRAFMNKEKYYGVTVHHISKRVDSGKIIYQEKKLLKNYNLKRIYSYIFSKLEPRVIKKSLIKIKKI